MKPRHHDLVMANRARRRWLQLLAFLRAPAAVVHADVVGVVGVVAEGTFDLAAGVLLAGPLDDPLFLPQPAFLVGHGPLLDGRFRSTGDSRGSLTHHWLVGR